MADDVRGELAAALIDARLIRWREPELALEFADALLPVVQRLAVKELRAAQRRATTRDYMTTQVRAGALLVADDLGARADALAAAAQPTDGATT